MKSCIYSLLILFMTLFTSCEKLSASGNVNLEERQSQQTEILDRLNRRIQIFDADADESSVTLLFADLAKYKIFYEDCLVLKVSSDGKYWIINGEQSVFPIVYDSEKKVIVPELTVVNGNWQIDGSDSGISASNVFEKQGFSFVSVIFLMKEAFFNVKEEGPSFRVKFLQDISLAVPSYFSDTVAEKEKAVESVIRSADKNHYSFVFFSDSHWGRNTKHSPAIIKHVVDYTPLTDVIFGGDVITTSYTNLASPMTLGQEFQSAFSFLGPKFYCLYGNHDNNSDSQAQKTQYHLSDDQVYSYLQSQMTDVTYSEGFNFYYDDFDSKTRVIGLDTGRYYYSQFRGTLPATAKFVIEALNTVPENWHVVMASHIWCLLLKDSEGKYYQTVASYLKPILKIFDDYNSRGSGDCTYNKEKIPYDFSSSAGKIEFCIGGHTHSAFDTKTDGGIPVIIVNSDSEKQPKKGTSEEQSVTLAVADYLNGKLHLFVVGRGDDRVFDL